MGREDSAVKLAESINVPEKQDFEDSSLYVNVYKYVEEYMGRYDMSHDFNHIRRVLALSKHILAAELKDYPEKTLDSQAVVLGALLHDVGDRKYVEPGENAAQLVSDVLTKNGCTHRLVAKVSIIVENVSYSNEVKRPQLVKAIVASHPELAVVQDADRLDAIGAIGIGRVFAYGAAKESGRGMQGSIDHFAEKLEKLEGMMKTETGRLLAQERTQRLRDFRQWWQEENEIFT
ncbi:hypothetical protein M409DRAFT_21526 [Zasmidium cellare ATCC 36951]|uniref:HD/PDEase domain-containing protein n=1 Tax=Zasmidium cellare ATCC 36951 TaxID=1080233 RepID=A0A6A6CPL9_ZASCE|nr:uncharacterized protein M409DRAFT_21526 [Zasmidium cellare ATCC 36951]KAF2168080.1 hypothetical protein M409DRAFT_21526 [Zasmidium cellare ATCC 36951]